MIVCIAPLLILHTIITNPDTAGTVNATGNPPLGPTWVLPATTPLNPLDVARFPGTLSTIQGTGPPAIIEVLAFSATLRISKRIQMV